MVSRLKSLLPLAPLLLLAPETWAQNAVETRVAPLPDERLPTGFIESVDLEQTFLDGQSAADALQDVPGLSVRRQSSLGQSAFVQVRGGNPRQLAVSLDGFRIHAPFGAGFDLGTLAVPGLDTLTVYKGASGVLFGSGALSGALDLSTRSAGQPGVHGGLFAASFGTYGLSVDGQTHAHNTTTLRVAAQARQAQGDFPFVDPQGTPHLRQNNASDRLGALLNLDHRFDPRHRLRATTLFDGGTRGVPGPSEFQTQNQNASLDEQRLVSTARYDVRDAFHAGPLATDLRTQLGAQSRAMTYTNPTSLLGNTFIHNRSDYHALGASLTANGYAGPWVLRANLDAHTSAYASTESLSPESTIETQRHEYSLGASTEYAVGAWTTLGGLRMTSTSGDRSDLQMLPFVGLKWSPMTSVSVSANFARTHRHPDFDELYLDLETLRGNPNLNPETALHADLGVHYRTETYAIGAAYFENQTDQTILFLPVSSLVIAAQNLDGVRSRGLEAQAQLVLHPHLLLGATYTLTRSQREGSDLQMPHQPLHQGGLRLDLQAWPNLTFHAAAHARSQTHLDNFGNLKAPAWVTVDAGLRWTQNTWTLSLNAQNLLDDQRRLDSLQQPLPGRALSFSVQTHTP